MGGDHAAHYSSRASTTRISSLHLISSSLIDSNNLHQPSQNNLREKIVITLELQLHAAAPRMALGISYVGTVILNDCRPAPAREHKCT